MKKTIKNIIAAAVAVTALSAASAETISLANTFGGDTDKLQGKDFFTFDKDGNKTDVHPSDRVQLDLASKKIDSRVRLDINGSESLKGSNPTFQITGYVNYKPWDFLNLIAGNKFFAKHTLSGAYLAALDNYPTTGKLADDNGAAVVFNKYGIQASAGIGYESALDLNFGVSYTVKNIFSFGGTAQNVTNSSLASYSGYAKLLAVKNLFFDAGYSYNFTGGILSNTKHALQFSTGYDFKKLGLSFYFDGLFGLTSDYYNTKSEIDDEYTDANDNSFAPFKLVFLTKYKATENFSVAANASVTQAANNGDKSIVTVVYPYADYNTPFGVVRAGARFNFNDKDGYNGFSIPLSWVYKLGLKK